MKDSAPVRLVMLALRHPHALCVLTLCVLVLHLAGVIPTVHVPSWLLSSSSASAATASAGRPDTRVSIRSSGGTE